MNTWNRYVQVVAVLIVISSVAGAQDYNRAAKKDLREMEETEPFYPKRPKSLAQRQVEVTNVKTIKVLPAAQSAQAQGAVVQQPPVEVTTQTQIQQPAAQITQAPQPIYILQQPTTNVDASAIKESRADQLKKQREEFEHQNETKLIERLEDDRLNAEKERLDRILGQKTPAPTPAPTPAVVATPAPAPSPVPAPAVVAPVPQTTVVVVPPAEPVAPADTTIKAAKEEIKDEKKDEKSRLAIAGLVGIGNYPTASNVSGAYALGASVELTLPNRFAVEGTVAYSSYDIQNVGYCYYCLSTTLVTTMNQWDITGGVKYKILPGTVTPVVGALLGYSRRDYQARLSWGYGNGSGTGSNAFEAGLLAGAEIKCTENLTIGADFRYMMNISYRTDNPLAYGFFGNSVYVGSPIESLNYYIASLIAKISF